MCTSLIQASIVAVSFLLIFKVCRSFTTQLKLRGPPPSSWLFGVSKDLAKGDSGALFEKWASEFGPAFYVPGPFGSRRIVLFDAKSISYFFTKETFSFRQSEFAKKAIASIVSYSYSFPHRN